MTSEEYETLTQLEERCLKTLEDDVPIAVALMHRIVRELLDRIVIDVGMAAKHAQAEERAAVVAWLRAGAERIDDATLAHTADCIEDGEHRTQEEP